MELLVSRTLLVLCLGAALCCALQGAEEEYDPNVYFHAGAFNTRRALSVLDGGDVRLMSASPGKKNQYIVKFKDVMGQSDLATFETEARVTLLDYLPKNAFIVFCTEQTARLASRQEGVAWVGLHRSEHRLEGGLLEHANTAQTPASLLHQWDSLQLYGDDLQHVEPMEARRRGSLLVSLLDDNAGGLHATAEELSVEWLPLLRNEVGERADQVAVTVESHRRLRVSGVPSESRGIVSSFLSSQPETAWVAEDPHIVILNHVATGLVQSGSASTTPFWDAGITGEGQIVGVGDTGLDDHCHFWDTAHDYPVNTVNTSHRKVVSYKSLWGHTYDNNSGHGTHVASSVCGKPTGSTSQEAYTYRGVAYEAKVAFTDISGLAGGIYLPGDLAANYFPTQRDSGAAFSSNSWGSPCTNSAGVCQMQTVDGKSYCQSNYYSSGDRDVDKYMNNNKDFLILFAAGNDGDCGLRSVSNAAKNGLTVGASQNGKESWDDLGSSCSGGGVCYEKLAYFSSRGETRDQRFKPDIVAPGYYIKGANSDKNSSSRNCDETYKAGTSMATPVVAGLSALVRQYFMDGFYPTGAKVAANAFTPTAQTVKAVLIHSSLGLTTLSGSVPHIEQGYGRVEIDRTLYLAGSSGLDFNNLNVHEEKGARALSTGDEREYCVTANTSKPFKATLTWSDPEGAYSTGGLVNDLDLVVDGTHKGNGGSSADRLNNSEFVSIYPTSHNVCTKVVAYNVPGSSSSQEYTLVLTFMKSDTPTALATLGSTQLANNDVEVTWTAPANGDTPFTYKIEQSVDVGFSTGVTVVASSTSSLTQTINSSNFAYGMTYYFRVTPSNSKGNGPSSISSLVYEMPGCTSVQVQCADGTCVSDSSSCGSSSCSAPKQLCSNGYCLESCPSSYNGCPAAYRLCSNGDCKATEAECAGGCTTNTQGVQLMRCYDGTCNTAALCPEVPYQATKPVQTLNDIAKSVAKSLSITKEGGGVAGSVSFAANAVLQDAYLSIEAVADSVIRDAEATSYLDHSTVGIVSGAVSLTFVDAANSVLSNVLNSGVETTITFETTLPTGVASTDICLAYLDGSLWTCVDRTVTQSGTTFSGTTTHFSTFSLVKTSGLQTSSSSSDGGDDTGMIVAVVLGVLGGVGCLLVTAVVIAVMCVCGCCSCLTAKQVASRGSVSRTPIRPAASYAANPTSYGAGYSQPAQPLAQTNYGQTQYSPPVPQRPYAPQTGPSGYTQPAFPTQAGNPVFASQQRPNVPPRPAAYAPQPPARPQPPSGPPPGQTPPAYAIAASASYGQPAHPPVPNRPPPGAFQATGRP